MASAGPVLRFAVDIIVTSRATLVDAYIYGEYDWLQWMSVVPFWTRRWDAMSAESEFGPWHGQWSRRSRDGVTTLRGTCLLTTMISITIAQLSCPYSLSIQDSSSPELGMSS